MADPRIIMILTETRSTQPSFHDLLATIELSQIFVS